MSSITVRKTPTTPKVVLSIAGSDSSGGAGIQADLKTFAAHHVYGATVITALTAIHKVPAPFVKQQYDAIANDFAIAAIKIGMLADAEIASIVLECIKERTTCPIVLDPVMVATSGDKLLDNSAIEVIKTKLCPLATIVTPNRAEAAILTSTQPYTSDEEATIQAKAILALGAKAVLMKGGHAANPIARDIFVTRTQETVFNKPWIATDNLHGTGCTLSSAIAANLANGDKLKNAVSNAKDYLWNAICAAKDAKLGNGNGPVDHDYARLTNHKSRAQSRKHRD